MADQPESKSRQKADAGKRAAAARAEVSDTRPLSVPPPDLTGRVLGDFRVQRRLGSGGMGDVYLAEQVSLKRPVAIKILRPDLAADPTFCKRFEIEATAAAKLAHANIVQIYSIGEHDGLRYMVLEYVPGMNLRDYVTRKGPLGMRFALRVLQQVGAALHRAGELGFIHRDIKPDNILLTRQGEVKVADFGLARSIGEQALNLTRSGVTMGTPLYMSPEQVEGKSLDPRSDLYSLGVTAYYMLAGRPPFRGDTAVAVAMLHLKGEPEPLAKLRPDLPPSLVQIVAKLMAKQPDARYQTGRELLKDVQKLAIEQTATELAPEIAPADFPEGEAAEPSAGRSVPKRRRFVRLRRWIAEHRRTAWLAASMVGALFLGAAAGWWRREPNLYPPPAPSTAQAPAPWEKIENKGTAKAQYDHAQLMQVQAPEAAWLAVVHYYPEGTPWVHRAQLQLGRYYIEKRQLESAAQLFDDMQKSADRYAAAAGRIGHALVLGLQDQAKEAVSLLDEIRQAPEVAGDRQLFDLLLHAYEQCFRHLGIDWPSETQRWAQQEMQKRLQAQPKR
jgi:serine/threonine-protein kinase